MSFQFVTVMLASCVLAWVAYRHGSRRLAMAIVAMVVIAVAFALYLHLPSQPLPIQSVIGGGELSRCQKLRRDHEGTKNTKGHEAYLYKEVFVPSCLRAFVLSWSRYHTRHELARTIGCPAVHENALANSGMFDTTPLTR